MPKHQEIKITEAELKFIHGKDHQFFLEKILSNCYCPHCRSGYKSAITNYQIFLNDINDVILRGFCAKCGGRMNRYTETGEVPEYLPRIKKVKLKYAN